LRFAFADLKKTITRRDGEPRVTPYLLRPGQLLRELAALIALYASWEGCERANFPSDRAAELIGDYRLARCLEMCLSEWYEWRSPAWPGPASALLAAELAARGITSASTLRLTLFDVVNARAGGYLSAEEREPLLAAFAAELAIPRVILDLLLALDVDDEAILQRLTSAAPTPAELAARYNQRAVEVMLANAGAVEWRIPAEMTDSAGRGLGSVLKRICFLARQMGVLYDVTFEDTPSIDDSLRPSPPHWGGVGEGSLVAERAGLHLVPPAALDDCGRALIVTLYGPQEVTGAPNQYGERLARLCRALLGYRRAPDAERRAALAGEGLRGSARVYLHGRPLLFALDERLLALLRPTGGETPENLDDTVRQQFVAASDVASTGAAPAVPDFDSSIEARLYADFAALEAIDEAHGWHLEREPEPLLADNTILVPDFALTRDRRRVYLEVAGYWPPGYRERKVRKLHALRGRVALILAAPSTAQAEFAPLAADYPLLWYGEAIGAQALLALLDRAYDDFDQRLAALDLSHISAEITARGRVTPAQARELLHCYTRAELARALQRVSASAGESTPVWIEGLGLCSAPWLASVAERATAFVAASGAGRLPLATLRERLLAAYPDLGSLDDVAAEALARQTGLRIERVSIFTVEVTLPDMRPDAPPAEHPESAASGTQPPAAQGVRRAQPRASARRKHTRPSYVTQPFLVPESPSD
jgi:predicted nuclease of restriction endonuclease-like RecB superfamily